MKEFPKNIRLSDGDEIELKEIITHRISNRKKEKLKDSLGLYVYIKSSSKLGKETQMPLSQIEQQIKWKSFEIL